MSLALEMLKKLEWGDDGYCPECVRSRQHGHSQGCLLAKALVEATGVQRAVDWLLSYAREQSDKGHYDHGSPRQQRDGAIKALAIRDAADQMKKALT